MPKNCPWCGYALAPDSIVCDKCKWTRNKPNMRPAILAYGFFIFLSIVLGIAAMQWVAHQTGDLRPSMNLIAPFRAEMRMENRE